MATVRAFSIDGLKLIFYSRDHIPPHFHVIRKGEWEIRVYFLECTEDLFSISIKRGKGPDRKDVKQLLAMVLQHKKALLSEWSAINTREDEL